MSGGSKALMVYYLTTQNNTADAIKVTGDWVPDQAASMFGKNDLWLDGFVTQSLLKINVKVLSRTSPLNETFSFITKLFPKCQLFNI